MKTISYLLPVGLRIGTVATWCRKNSIPALFKYGEYKKTPLKHWLNAEDLTNEYDQDTLIIRDSDYEMVRLRF